MKQTRRVLTGLENQSELMAGAFHHLRNAMETGSGRSRAIACMLFTCLAQDETLGTASCDACRGLDECLEGMTESSARRARP